MISFGSLAQKSKTWVSQMIFVGIPYLLFAGRAFDIAQKDFSSQTFKPFL